MVRTASSRVLTPCHFHGTKTIPAAKLHYRGAGSIVRPKEKSGLGGGHMRRKHPEDGSYRGQHVISFEKRLCFLLTWLTCCFPDFVW